MLCPFSFLTMSQQRKSLSLGQGDVGRVVEGYLVGPGDCRRLPHQLPIERHDLETKSLEEPQGANRIGFVGPRAEPHGVQNLEKRELGDDELAATGLV